MTDEPIEWTDSLSITIRETDRTTDNQDDQIIIEISGEQWPRRWLMNELRALGTHPETHEPMYVLRQETTEMSWGADGSQANLFLEVAQGVWDGIVDNGVWALITMMAAKLRSARDPSPLAPLTEQEAETRARWLIESKHGVKFDDLELRSVEIAEGTRATVVLRDPSNRNRFEVEYRLVDGLVLMVRLKRIPG